MLIVARENRQPAALSDSPGTRRGELYGSMCKILHQKNLLSRKTPASFDSHKRNLYILGGHLRRFNCITTPTNRTFY